MRLYYNKKHEAYFLVGEEYKCVMCDCDLYNTAVVVKRCNIYRKYIKDYKAYVCCESCSQKGLKFFGYKEVTQALIIAHVPKNSVPVLFVPPTLSDHTGNDSVYMASERESDSITDSTVYSYRESWEGANIGNFTHEDDKITFEDATKLLEMFKGD